MVPENAGAAWAPQMVWLNKLIREGHSVHHIAQTLGRSTRSIECKLESMGLKEKWSPYKPGRKAATKIEPPKKVRKDMSKSNDRKVTIRVFIGETEAKNLTNDDIIEAIEQEEAFIKRLGMIKVFSPKWNRIAKVREKNIAALLDLLADEGGVDDDDD